MSKTIKEKAKEWDCSESTVRNYCSSGIIPPAEKVGIPPKWRIPDKWPKPPMTRHGLCYLMDTIYQLNHGVLYSSINWGYSIEEVKAGYDYLIMIAFISSIDTSCLADQLVNATVTPRGKSIIERENAEGKGKTNYRAHMTASATIGVASLEVGGEISNS